MWVHPHPPTYSWLTALAFPSTGASILHRTKRLPSHWYQIRQSSATYAAGAVAPCVYSLVGGLVPGSSGRSGWLILLLFLWGVKPLHILSPSPPLGFLCSVLWLAASIHIYIGHALAKPLREELYQAPVSKHFLVLAIVSGFGDCIWDGCPCGAVSGWPFLQSLFNTLSLYLLPWVLFPLLRRTEISTLWSFFLSFMWFVNCILGIPSFWVNIHLSVSAYHVCSFVIGLPHLG